MILQYIQEQRGFIRRNLSVFFVVSGQGKIPSPVCSEARKTAFLTEDEEAFS